MEERRRLSRCFQLLFELIPPSADRDQLVLDVSPANTLHNRFNDFSFGELRAEPVAKVRSRTEQFSLSLTDLPLSLRG